MHQSNFSYMLQKFEFLILLMFAYGFSHAQNLVPNPGFEEETIVNAADSNCIKYSFPQWKTLKNDGCGVDGTNFFDFREYLKVYNAMLTNYTVNWRRDSGGKKYAEGRPGFKDDGKHLYFYKYDSTNKQEVTASIDTSYRYYKPIEGNCYIRNVLSARKELFQIKLKRRLEKDSCYRFEMYYFFPRFFVKDPSFFHVGRFGVFFTNADLTDKEYANKIDDITYNPQILVKDLDSNALKGWAKYSKVFTAKENAKYLIIGNHQPFNIPDIASPITYYIDCVKIVKHKCPEIEYGISDTTQIMPVDEINE